MQDAGSGGISILGRIMIFLSRVALQVFGDEPLERRPAVLRHRSRPHQIGPGIQLDKLHDQRSIVEAGFEAPDSLLDQHTNPLTGCGSWRGGLTANSEKRNK
jgi:hypothetical protein